MMNNSYKQIEDEFKTFLDSSMDADSLLLEAMPIVYDLCRNCSSIFDKFASKRRRQNVYNNIRTIWDIAYTYGFQDAIYETRSDESLAYD